MLQHRIPHGKFHPTRKTSEMLNTWQLQCQKIEKMEKKSLPLSAKVALIK